MDGCAEGGAHAIDEDWGADFLAETTGPQGAFFPEKQLLGPRAPTHVDGSTGPQGAFFQEKRLLGPRGGPVARGPRELIFQKIGSWGPAGGAGGCTREASQNELNELNELNAIRVGGWVGRWVGAGGVHNRGPPE